MSALIDESVRVTCECTDRGGGERTVRVVIEEMCSGSEEGSYLRLIGFCITQL